MNVFITLTTSIHENDHCFFSGNRITFSVIHFNKIKSAFLAATAWFSPRKAIFYNAL